MGLLFVLAVELAANLPLRNKNQMLPMNNMNFARLKKPIGKPTAAAKAQTSSSRKLKVVLSKMGVVVVQGVSALSVIHPARQALLGAARLLCFPGLALVAAADFLN